MKLVRFIAAAFLLALMVAGTASAQNFGSTYDWQSGNMYRWNSDSMGNTHVYGNNFNTGSMWNSTIQPNGNQSGWDSQMNHWNYNAQTGAYFNSNGHGCIGHGYGRTCW